VLTRLIERRNGTKRIVSDLAQRVQETKRVAAGEDERRPPWLRCQSSRLYANLAFMLRNSRRSKPRNHGVDAASGESQRDSTTNYTTKVALRRVMEIDQLIRQMRYPNKPWLARHFEISERTIERDFQQMRDQLHLRPIYDRKRNGFYYADDPPCPPDLVITEGDFFHLAIARFAIEAQRGLNFEASMRHTFDKFAQHLDARLNATIDGLRAIISFQPSGFPAPVDPKIFDAVHVATAARRELQLMYQKPEDAKPRLRTLEPLHLTVYNQAWYFLAREAGDPLVKRWMVSRATKPRQTGREFPCPENFDPAAFLSGGFGMFGNANPERILLRFSRKAAPRVKERIWHDSQELSPKRNGEIEMRLYAEVNFDLDQFLWSWGGEVRVLEPAHLRTRLCAAAEAVLERNRK